MAKKIAGNYPDTDAVAELMDSLAASGYPVDSITVIADSDLVDLDDIGVALEDGFDSLGDLSDELLCQRIEDFFVMDDTGMYVEEVTTVCGSLRDGDILVLVEDTLLPEDSEAFALLYGEDEPKNEGKAAKHTSTKPKAKAPSKTKAAPKPKA